MSVEHMALVFDAEGLSGPQKLLLLAYTNYTDPHGYCWPGIERLAADTGTSKRTVIRVRKELEAANLLRHQRRTKRSGESDTNLYRVNIDKLRSLRRRPTNFDDNAFGLEFEDAPADSEIATYEGAHDQPICQPDTQLTSRYANLTRGGCQSATPGGGNLAPNPSSDPPEILYPDPDARARDGRTEEVFSEITEEHRRLAGVIRSRLDVRRIDARPKQVREIEEAMAAALARGVGFEAVARHAEAKLREARTCRYFITAFEPEHLPVEAEDAAAAVEVPPWCGECDPEGRDKPTLRRIEDEFGSIRRCPRCHPDAVLAEAARNTA